MAITRDPHGRWSTIRGERVWFDAGSVMGGEFLEPVAIPDLTHTTTVLYKSRGGELKELHIKQPLEPGKVKFDFTDMQLLAREIAKVLKEDG